MRTKSVRKSPPAETLLHTETSKPTRNVDQLTSCTTTQA